MKYGTWNTATYTAPQVDALQQAGYSPLTARVLCSRGITTAQDAARFLACDAPLCDPFLLREMDAAAARILQALEQGEKIAIYGDYDVDGITATCLLTDFLRTLGADCCYYIPSRLEEGYGLNRDAIARLHAQHVRLIVTVDCGITAVEEAALCRELGIDLIITDHHECKAELPDACAVVDPHRPDATYPHQGLSGVGVAFKLACAICGEQEAALARYCDLVCLGTIADVMPLRGENRRFVRDGLQALQKPRRVGLAALIRECGLGNQEITATTVGYILAPRINAAGRMGRVELAVELFLTEQPAHAAQLAQGLCQLNKQRQSIEAGIYCQAVAMLPAEKTPPAIVLAGDTWHQGVVGIVASRLAEEYSCPTFLICLDGEHGKASSRSYGGFNLFASLRDLADLLENYGGHELAAGFTIARGKIDTFRTEISRRAQDFAESGQAHRALEVDCTIPPELLTLQNIDGLHQLEPCGAGCPRPVFSLEQVLVEQLSEIGGGKHLRLKLRWGPRPDQTLSAIFFSTNALQAAIFAGDTVDVAFTPQINEYRGVRSVQLNLVDIRPCQAEREATQVQREVYLRHRRCKPITADEAESLLPRRPDFTAVWRYLISHQDKGRVQDDFACLCRKILRHTGAACSMSRIRVCLDVFDEMGLIDLEQQAKYLSITITAQGKKVDLAKSAIIRSLERCKQEDTHGNVPTTV